MVRTLIERLIWPLVWVMEPMIEKSAQAIGRRVTGTIGLQADAQGARDKIVGLLVMFAAVVLAIWAAGF